MTIITEQLGDTGSWSLDLDPDTPAAVLDALNPATNLWATYVHTPAHYDIGDLSEADLFGVARYAGTLVANGENRLSPNGESIARWLGKDGDGGVIYKAPKGVSLAKTLATHLGQVFPTNGLSLGSTTGVSATTFRWGFDGGDTRREWLDTLLRQAPGGPYWWRLRYSGGWVVDVGPAATLWPSTTTPTVILTEAGGRDAHLYGWPADIDLAEMNGDAVRTRAIVNWNDNVNNGTATATLPSTYADLTSGTPQYETYLDWQPRRRRPPTERWRRVAAWSIRAQTQANALAAAEVNERSAIRYEASAAIVELSDPWAYDLTPGNRVWVEDFDRGIYDTANQIVYRGEVCFPRSSRVDEMTYAPASGGHYLRYYTGAAFAWLDLTRYVVPGDGGVTLGLDRRDRFPVSARRRRLGKPARRAWYRRARRAALIQRYVDAQRR